MDKRKLAEAAGRATAYLGMGLVGAVSYFGLIAATVYVVRIVWKGGE